MRVSCGHGVTQLLKFLPVYCVCEMKSLQALISPSISGPSCAQEDLANLEMVKIFCAVYVTVRYFFSALTKNFL